MTDPVSFFRSVAARHPRCFWLDGGGAREWSGRRSIIGWLDEDDASLSWSAARREVTLHAGGVATVVGDDVFAVLEHRIAAGEQWFGYLGYASRTDLPATPDPTLPDAVWMRPRAVRVFEHEVGASPLRIPRSSGESLNSAGGATASKSAEQPLPARTPPRSRASRSTCTPATPTRSTSPTACPASPTSTR